MLSVCVHTLAQCLGSYCPNESQWITAFQDFCTGLLPSRLFLTSVFHPRPSAWMRVRDFPGSVVCLWTMCLCIRDWVTQRVNNSSRTITEPVSNKPPMTKQDINSVCSVTTITSLHLIFHTYVSTYNEHILSPSFSLTRPKSQPKAKTASFAASKQQTLSQPHRQRRDQELSAKKKN